MKNELTMYLVTHKTIDFIPDGRTPIFVGSGNNVDKYLQDSSLDNISMKNPNYCELTAYYWIWKNDNSSKYICVEHYRRFFMNSFNVINPIKKVTLAQLLNKYNVIATSKYGTKMTLKEFYEKRHHLEDLELAEDRIRERYPQYVDSFNKVMNGHTSSMFNMVAMKKTDFDKYCEWLFDILFFVESRTNLEGRTSYQKRAFGFLAERLMNVWLDFNYSNIKFLPVYYLERNKILSVLKSMKSRIPSEYDPKKTRG